MPTKALPWEGASTQQPFSQAQSRCQGREDWLSSCVLAVRCQLSGLAPQQAHAQTPGM